MRGISWEAEDLLASQEGLCSTETVSILQSRTLDYHWLCVICYMTNAWEHVVVQVAKLVEALHQKVGGPGFDSRWGHWKFSGDQIILSAFSSPGVHSTS